MNTSNGGGSVEKHDILAPGLLLRPVPTINLAAAAAAADDDDDDDFRDVHVIAHAADDNAATAYFCCIVCVMRLFRTHQLQAYSIIGTSGTVTPVLTACSACNFKH